MKINARNYISHAYVFYIDFNEIFEQMKYVEFHWKIYLRSKRKNTEQSIIQIMYSIKFGK